LTGHQPQPLHSAAAHAPPIAQDEAWESDHGPVADCRAGLLLEKVHDIVGLEGDPTVRGLRGDETEMLEGTRALGLAPARRVAQEL
jgi:hypothetical protein